MRSMRSKRTAAVVGAAIIIGGWGTSAYAGATLSSSVIFQNGTVAERTITVNATGLNPVDGKVFIQQCWKNDAAAFNSALDCSSFNTKNPTIQSNGTATATFTVFSGDEPSIGEWGCGPNTSPGVPTASTCYIRLSPAAKTNTAADEFYPITFTATGPTTTTTLAPGTEVPEVPASVLLPLGAAAVIGGSVLVARRRTAKSA